MASYSARRRLRVPLVILFISLSCSLTSPVRPIAPEPAVQSGESLQSSQIAPLLPTDTPAKEPEANIPTIQPTHADLQAAPPVSAASIPDSSPYAWNLVASGYTKPVDLQHAGDQSGRIFIAEQGGVIRIIQFGEKLSSPFLDIQERVNDGGFEQGLLGLAFHPQYLDNGYFYVNYTDKNGDTIIARFSALPNEQDRADPDSELQLMRVEQPYGNHNGGGLDFGPDGYLYIGLGDGGSAGDPQNNGQSTTSLLGGLLRIDVNRGDRYGIPADNPFASGGGAPENWIYGLRNPWRFSFDRVTGELFIADVGQNQWEEVHYLAAGEGAGANLGWNFREGAHPYAGTPPENLQLINPVAEYPHAEGCSVSGGYVYRGQAWPDWYGVYFYGDYCTGAVWGLVQGSEGTWQNKIVFRTPYNISAFGEDEAGELFLVDHTSGAIFELGQP